ncbi:MAG: MarR family transcriptional regulator [Idiomarina sp.]|nr:MarR family transcriptional regulator [Idiomarina sp.]
MKYPNLFLENQLCHRIYMANHRLNRLYSVLLEPLNLTYPQYVVMMALWEEDRITLSALSERTQIDVGTLSLMMKKLVGKEFLYTEADASDKRKRYIILTETGRRLTEKANDLPQQVLCACPNVSEEDLKELSNLLDKLNGRPTPID